MTTAYADAPATAPCHHYATAGDLDCLLCGRHVAVLVEQNGHATVKLARPEYADAARTLRCPTCDGRLMRGEIRDVVISRMTPEQWRALPVEQPKIGRPPRLCVDCRIVTVKQGQQRCRACWRDQNARTSNRSRLVQALAGGHPKHRAELCLTLGMTLDTLGATVQNARLVGHQIAYRNGFYALEGQP